MNKVLLSLLFSTLLISTQAQDFERGSLWTLLRTHFQLTATQKEEAMIQKQLQWYQQHPDSLKKTLARAQMQLHYITTSLIVRGMPTELALIPMMESHCNPFAYSQVGARGIWQIMPSLGSGYGLKENHWFDEKRDIILSTNRALDHLSYLSKLYKGNWRHAIYAYNAGEGRINTILKKNKNTTPITLTQLPKETQQYLPKILALQRLIASPERYNIQLPRLDNSPFFMPVSLKNTVTFAQISKQCSIAEETLRNLNPSYRRESIVPARMTRQHPLILPAKHAVRCQAILNQAHNTQLDHANSLRYHTVSKSETLASIAKRFHVTRKAVSQINWINEGESLTPGRVLLIPSASSKHSENTASIAKHRISGDYLPGPVQITHTTRKRDTLESIARTYKTKVEKIRFWNKQAKLKPMQPGQSLTIWMPEKKFTYKVQKGDTLEKLARSFKTTPKAITQLNRLKSSLIKPDQLLHIRQHAIH